MLTFDEDVIRENYVPKGTDSVPIIGDNHEAIAFTHSNWNSRDFDGKFRVYLVLLDNPDHIIEVGYHEAGINTLEFSPNGRELATSSNDKFAVIWPLYQRDSPKRFEHKGRVFTASFDSSGEKLITGSMVSGPLDDDFSVNSWSVREMGEPDVISSMIKDLRGIFIIPTIAEDNIVVYSSYQAWLFEGGDPARMIYFYRDGVLIDDFVVNYKSKTIMITTSLGEYFVWPSDWTSYVNFLNRYLKSCLLPDRRIAWLLEDQSDAIEKYSSCKKTEETSVGLHIK